jgi:hypothetical protein
MESMLPDGGFVEVEPHSFDVHDPKYGGLPQYPGQACEDWQTHTGAFVECDIEYPAELHDLHSDYPLLPESMIVEDHMIAPIQRRADRARCKKLVAHLYDRKNYTVHITALKFAIGQGLKITKVHRVLEFHQSA